MTREEEKQEKARELAIKYCKDVDPHGKEVYNIGCAVACCEMADWADQHPRKGLWDAEKVCKWISERIGIDQKIEIDSNGEPLADSYIAYCIARQNAADTIIKDLRKAMEE